MKDSSIALNFLLRRYILYWMLMYLASPFILNAQKEYIVKYGDMKFMQVQADGLNTLSLKDSLPDGKWIVVSEDNYSKAINSRKRIPLIFVAEYCRGTRNGVYTSYHYTYANGHEIKNCTVSHYQEGYLNGIFENWSDTQLVLSGYYENGLRVGEWNSYDLYTKSTTVFTYRNDSLIGKTKFVNNRLIISWKLEQNLYQEFTETGEIKSVTVLGEHEPYTKLFGPAGNVVAEGKGFITDKDVIRTYVYKGRTDAVLWRNKIGKWKYYDNKGNLMKEE